MRNGYYAIYNGQEYEVGQVDSRRYELMTYDRESVKRGFKYHPAGCYVKTVSSKKIQ